MLPKRGEFNARAVGDAQAMQDNSPGDLEPMNVTEKSNAEIYEEQYDPNQEFRIFGIGDKTKGGVQSLQQKMNMADDLASDESSDSNEEEDGDKKEQAAVPENPQSVKNQSNSFSDKEALMRASTPQGSITNSDSKQGLLPED